MGKKPTSEIIIGLVVRGALACSVQGLPTDAKEQLDKLTKMARDNEAVPENYSEYIGSKEWGMKRQEALNYYGSRCNVCLSTNQLHVHHRSYENFGNEEITDIVVLCLRCHAYVHPHGVLALNWFDKRYFMMGPILVGTLDYLNIDDIPQEIFAMFRTQYK